MLLGKDYDSSEKGLIYFFIPKILTTFALALVYLLLPQRVIKRESGENPEQSRCCKLFTTFRIILLPLFQVQSKRY
jgi:hypothetical protein